MCTATETVDQTILKRSGSFVPNELVELFDIEVTAPNIDVISSVREKGKITNSRWRFFKAMGYLGFLIVLVAGCSGIYAALHDAYTLKYFFVGSIGAVFVLIAFIFVSELRHSRLYFLHMLNPIHPDDCDNLAVMLEKTDSVQVHRYRDEVTNQFREFCNAEFILIKNYLDNYKKQRDEEFKKIRLYQPDAYRKALDEAKNTESNK